MWFSIDRDSSTQQLRYVTSVNDGWYLHSYLPLTPPTTTWGYRFASAHSGNAITIQHSEQNTHIDFAFFKDFDLRQDLAKGILLTNLPGSNGTAMPKDVISIEFGTQGFITHKADWKALLGQRGSLSQDQVIIGVMSLLRQNIVMAYHDQRSRHAVFTGGLDSGAVCAILDSLDLEHKVIINQLHDGYWPDLQHRCIVASAGHRSEAHSPYSFYQPEFSGALTGFYGDTVCLHNASLYAQSHGLIGSHIDDENLYDQCQESWQPFSNMLQIDQAIRHIVLQTRFVHWYPDFDIIDPYRDPEILGMVCRLSNEDLIRQFGQAWLQRSMIQQVAPEWSARLCVKKNDYDRFTS